MSQRLWHLDVESGIWIIVHQIQELSVAVIRAVGVRVMTNWGAGADDDVWKWKWTIVDVPSEGVSYTRCTTMHHSKDHFAAHILSTPFQITRWKDFHWSYSTKCAQIILRNFCTAIFYDLNSIWHQIIWFCKLLVKFYSGWIFN